MARVCIIREVEVECAIDIGQTAVLALSTDLPGEAMGVRHSETLTGTGERKVYNFRVAGTITGRMIRTKFSPAVAAVSSSLYRIRLYLRVIGTPAKDWHWYPMPVVPTNEEWLTAPLPIPPTPEEWSTLPVDIPPTPEDYATVPVPIPPTPEDWSVVPVPVPPTPEEFTTVPLPIKPANSVYQWLPVPVEET